MHSNNISNISWVMIRGHLYVVADAMYLQSPLLLSPLLQFSPLLPITVPSVTVSVPSVTITIPSVTR